MNSDLFLEDLQKNPYDQELHFALVSAHRETASLQKLRAAREEAAALAPWRQALLWQRVGWCFKALKPWETWGFHGISWDFMESANVNKTYWKNGGFQGIYS